MSSFKEVARAKFKEKLASIGEFHVDEWDITVYFRPQTLKEMGVLEDGRASSNSSEVVVDNVIARALDSDMTPLFKRAERQELLREYDPITLADISMAITKWDAELRESAGN